MSGSSQPSTQVVTQQIDPAMQPYIAYGLSEAQKLYQTPGTPSYFPGQGYVSPSEATQQALQFGANRAVQGNPLLPQSQQTAAQLQTAVNPAQALYGNLYNNPATDPSRGIYEAVSSGAMTDQATQSRINQLYGQAGAGDPSAGFYQAMRGGQLQNAAMPAFQSLAANPQGDPSAGFYQAMQGGQFQNAALPQSQQTASGAYLGGNPFFTGAFNAAANQASQSFQDQMQQVASQASRAGRYGSNAMGQLQDRATGAFAGALTDAAGKLAYQNYGAERQMQEAAQGRVGALSQQDIANRMAGAQGLTSGAQQQIANQMAALSNIGTLSQQDIANRAAGAQALTSGAQQQLASQLALTQAGGSQAQQALQNRLAGAQALTASSQQAYQNQMAAAAGLGGTAAADYTRQLQAAGLGPQMAMADYADIDRLYQTGQAQESYQQAALADQMQRYQFQQNLPAAKLQSFLSAAYGAPMGQQTTQPIYRNQAANIFGGAALGGALGGSQYGQLGSALGAGAGLFGLLG